MKTATRKRATTAMRWARHLGASAFLFFLIKGILWLTVPVLLTYFAAR